MSASHFISVLVLVPLSVDGVGCPRAPRCGLTVMRTTVDPVETPLGVYVIRRTE